MGVSTRHTRRILAAYRKEGAAALAHGNRGRRPANATPKTTSTGVVRLARTRYFGVNHTHLSELLWEREGIDIDRSTLRRILVRAGVNSPRSRRPPKHLVRRQRMPREGMLIQVDGSFHRWLGKDGPQFTLLLALDDASGTVVNALFCELENTRSYFLLLDGLIRRRGIPLALYADRHAVFKHTPSRRRLPPAPLSSVEQWTSSACSLSSLCRLRRRVEWNAPQERSRTGSSANSDLRVRLPSMTPTECWSTSFHASTNASRCPRRSRKSPIAQWTKGCVWRGSCASSTGAESPGTTRSDTAGAPCNCCPARTGRPMPEQLWMCLKDCTIAWRCSTRGATSLLRKRRHVRAYFAASQGEPHTHPSSISLPTVWVANG